uniref:G-protein coupled receptors family 2 profile 1 domain-containing protein n=1 Tax=Sinocyclocheilus grahami TaxID=75366 RepID=A0A672M3G4_SINGR
NIKLHNLLIICIEQLHGGIGPDCFCACLLGPYCNRTWDGWLCWDDTPAGTYTSQNCPNYFPDFDSTGTIHSFVI